MSSKFSLLASAMPTFTKKDTVEAKVDALANYQVQLLEYLRYTLGNLDADNFNPSGLQEILEPVVAEIKDADGNILDLWMTAEELAAKIEDAEGNYTSLKTTVEGLETEIAGVDGKYTSISATVNGIQSTVSNHTTTINNHTNRLNSQGTSINSLQSQITQTANEIAAVVSAVDDSSGKVTAASIVAAINATSGSSMVMIEADHILMTGTTTFVSEWDLGANGNTVIDGGRIQSGVISGIVLESPGQRAWEDVSIHDGMVEFYSGYIKDFDLGVLGISAGELRIYISGDYYFSFSDSGIRYCDPSGNVISQAVFQ